MKGILSNSEIYHVKRVATSTAGSDKILVQIDAGNAQNGTLILIADVASSSALANLEIWTAPTTGAVASGTQAAANTSTGVAKIPITSDNDTLLAEVTLGVALTTKLTVASNKVSSISEDGVYLFNIKNCSRYITCQYDSDGVGSTVEEIFIGHDLDLVPWGGARTAF